MPIPASIAKPTTTAHTVASSAFSPSSASAETRPRRSRSKVFSSRSSASIPEASSRQTNIIETVTAIATA